MSGLCLGRCATHDPAKPLGIHLLTPNLLVTRRMVVQSCFAYFAAHAGSIFYGIVSVRPMFRFFPSCAGFHNIATLGCEKPESPS